jgi:hypothetical protein
VNALVCWDFDETLGYFRPHEFDWFGMRPPAGMPPPRVKPGIRALLASLAGFTHVVTTAALGDYAKRVLREHDLLDCFDAVFAREDGLCNAAGKDYAIVGKRFGVGEGELCRRLVIVGDDAKRDGDCRHRQVVVVHDARMMDRPAGPLGDVIRGLWNEKSFKGGFDAWFDRSGGQPVLLHEVQLKFEYWGSYVEKRVHPVVSTIFPMC